MRLLIIGALSGQIGAASQIAVARGARVSHADNIENALRVLRKGHGADLIMADVEDAIRVMPLAAVGEWEEAMRLLHTE